MFWRIWVTKQLMCPIYFNGGKYYGSKWGPLTVWLLTHILQNTSFVFTRRKTFIGTTWGWIKYDTIPLLISRIHCFPNKWEKTTSPSNPPSLWLTCCSTDLFHSRNTCGSAWDMALPHCFIRIFHLSHNYWFLKSTCSQYGL